MSRDIKNDRSECFVFDSYVTGVKNYYVAQVMFNDKKKEMFNSEDCELKGYYLLIVKCDYDDNLKEVSNPDMFFSDVVLLVQCERRSEGNFQKAMSMVNKVSNERIKVMEEDIIFMQNLGMSSAEVEEYIQRIKDGTELEGTDYGMQFEEPRLEQSNMVEVVDKKEKKGLDFSDVAGMHDVKEVLRDVIDQFKNPERYRHFGIKPIRALLLHGCPGTGKSFIANAFAGEIDAIFKKVSMGDIGSKYQNATSNNIKKLFDEARKANGNVVLFLDEVDSVASKRGTDENSKEKNVTLNTLLAEMSSEDNENIFLICATNFYDNLDDAFKRKGRIDVELEIPLPDFETRKGILELNTRRKPLSDDVDLDRIAKNLSGFNCADVDVLVNETARMALKRGKDVIEQVDFDDTMEEMVTGKASQTKKLDEKTKRNVAVHETGHLLANELLNVNKTKKISILSRGNTLGFLMHMNEDNEDVFLYNEDELKNRILVMLAGRANEEIFFGKATTGASDDLRKANNLLRSMITKYGYSDELSLLVVDENDVFMREKVNNLMIEKLNKLYKEIKDLLERNKSLSEVLVEALLEKEELNGEQVDEIIENFYTSIGLKVNNQ